MALLPLLDMISTGTIYWEPWFLDLAAFLPDTPVPSSADVVIPAQGKVIVPTGLSIAIPEGCYGRVAPRSGLAAKHFLDTGAGVIDADYRGPVGVVMFNFSKVDYEGKLII